MRAFVISYVKAASTWLAVLFVAFAVAGCVSRSPSSPLGEMMALTAKGEIACVRNDVVMRGRDACK